MNTENISPGGQILSGGRHRRITEFVFTDDLYYDKYKYYDGITLFPRLFVKNVAITDHHHHHYQPASALEL